MASALLRSFAVLLLVDCSRPDGPPPPPPPTPAQVDQDLLDLAFHDCFLADCERAYAHLAALPATSPLRQSDAYRAIQYRFDADRLLHADVEPDLTKRREILKEVAASPVTEGVLRLSASERIARLGAPTLGAATEVALNARADTPSAAVTAAEERADLLTKSKSNDPADQSKVRAVLEPKIFSGKATPEDVAMLRTVCKAQKDAACMKQLAHLILH